MMTRADPEAVRRLDWRFLLPDPTLGRVAFVTPGDQRLLRALGDAAGPVATGSASELATDPDGPWNVLVVAPATERVLAASSSLVPPGGWIYAELPRRAVMRGVLDRSTRLLQDAGFGPVGQHWHWPSVTAARRIVPIDHPAGARGPLERQLGRRLRGVEPLLATVLDAGRAVELVGGGVSLLARRGADGPSPWLCLEPLRAELGPGLFGEVPRWTMLTPRFRASAHVLVLLAPADTAPPRLVAKISRLPGTSGPLAREAANLRSLTEAALPADSVPRLIGVWRSGGHDVLVEGGLAGRPLDPDTVRIDPGGSIRLATKWLATMPTGAAAEPDHIDALLQEPLRQLAAAAPGRGGENARLVDATLAALEPLKTAGLPRTFEHGDFSHPNLLVADGRLRVLDWEAGRADGLPLHDLTFFLAYVAKAVGSVRDARGHPPALSQVLADPATGAVRALQAEADRLGIARDLLPALMLACWSRTVGSLAARQPASSPAPYDWLRSNRYYLLWRDALRRQSDLSRALR